MTVQTLSPSRPPTLCLWGSRYLGGRETPSHLSHLVFCPQAPGPWTLHQLSVSRIGTHVLNQEAGKAQAPAFFPAERQGRDAQWTSQEEHRAFPVWIRMAPPRPH